MRAIFFCISIGAFIAYFVYVLYWRIIAVSDGLIKKRIENAIEKSGRSTDLISWLLLFLAILFSCLFLAIEE